MFIQTEATPNPATIKFIPGQPVMGTGTAEYTETDDTTNSPLARRLFQIDGVKSIFFGGDFISVTKTEDALWDQLRIHILGVLMQHFTAGLPVVEGIVTPSAAHVAPEDEDELSKQIRELIETRVRPAVANDGGDIIFDRFEDGVVYLHMRGACAGCPSSTMTLKSGIENMLKHFVPEVQAVENAAEF
ncbi:MAG: NifU family protein [Alphaproteobacteria bacterium]|nr:NifU family protein [Alphaproteobacteria bacterium]